MLAWDLNRLQQLPGRQQTKVNINKTECLKYSKPIDACVALHGIDQTEREELVIVVVGVIQRCKQSAKERPASKSRGAFSYWY